MKNQPKKRIVLTISKEADRLLDDLAAQQVRSRSAVVEMLIKGTSCAHSVHKEDTSDAHRVHTEGTKSAHPVHKEDTSDAQGVHMEGTSNFSAAILALDEML